MLLVSIIVIGRVWGSVWFVQDVCSACGAFLPNMPINMPGGCVSGMPMRVVQFLKGHTSVPWITFVHRDTGVWVRMGFAQLIVLLVVHSLIPRVRHDHGPKIYLSLMSEVSQTTKRPLTKRIPSTTQRPDMIPILTQGKMLQSVCPSPDEPDSSGKKSSRQLFSAVVCRAADKMIHTAATANAAITWKMWNAT